MCKIILKFPLFFSGVESEPFIVASADDATNQFLLTVTDHYILEKDLEGEVTEVLDLQCLRSLQCLDKGGNEEDSAVVRLVFDYVRKDRQERKYLLEDDIDVKVCTNFKCGLHTYE